MVTTVRTPRCSSRFLVLASLVALVAAACSGASPATAPPAPAAANGADVGVDNLNAVLWMQTAVEYRATALQAFELGRRLLDEALADPAWTAALEQTGDYADLPPAVILDIDETVLDNSFFEARLTLDRQPYSEELWNEWVHERAARPIPGAREFLDYAVSRGVTIFYVTNRRAPLEESTRANLEAVDFPLIDERDTLLLRGEIPAWDTSDKTPRRRLVASSHRVLLMFGDNMGDFTGAADGTVAERAAFAEEHRELWGSRWITLANPTYGSFIGAVLDNDFSLPWLRQVEVKKRALDPLR